MTDAKKYAVISYSAFASSTSSTVPSTSSGVLSASHNLVTHASGDLTDYGLTIRGNEPEHGFLVTLEPNHKCIALHLNEGYITILPILQSYRYKSSSSTSTSSTNRKVMKSHHHHGLDFIGSPFHCRIVERDVFSMEFLHYDKQYNNNYMPQLTLLHQDSRGLQHVIAHSLDMTKKQLIVGNTTGVNTMSNIAATTSTDAVVNTSDSTTTAAASLKQNEAPIMSISSSVNSSTTTTTTATTVQPLPIHQRLKKSRVEAGSGMMIAVKPSYSNHKSTSSNTMDINVAPTGGILILGHHSITYHNPFENNNKTIPIPPCLFESYTQVLLPPSNVDLTSRYILGDDCGRIHILAIVRNRSGKVVDLHLDTLGETNVSSCLVYLDNGLFFLGSQYTDSQLIQILDQPVDSSSSSFLDDDDIGIEKDDTLLHGKNVTYLNIIEEYVNLGPIVDFDLLPTTHSTVESDSVTNVASTQKHQSMAITASGAGKDGSLRLVSNGIGMKEHAAAELPGIKGLWNIRKNVNDIDDAFLIQSYVGETRVLGIDTEDDSDMGDLDNSGACGGGATLAEVDLDGIDPLSTTLYAGNVSVGPDDNSSLIVQVTEKEVRLINLEAQGTVCTWSPFSTFQKHGDSPNNLITVASGNELGQIVLALGGGRLMYLRVIYDTHIKIELLGYKTLDKEISCLNLNPFDQDSYQSDSMDVDDDSKMDIDEDKICRRHNNRLSNKFVAVGLWDDVNVRILSLNEVEVLVELERVNIAPDVEIQQDSDLNQHLIARSLCFVSLEPTNNMTVSKEFRKSHPQNSVHMLLVGLGDGGLVSFIINVDNIGSSSCSIHSRKEVHLGTRAINLVPIYNGTANKGTCVLATGDRPTVIYLTGGGGSNKVPKLCYSNLNLESEAEEFDQDDSGSRARFERLIVNFATPFHSSSLFSASNSMEKSYSICISDEFTLRLGMIGDIQKLHVTTHKLGMAPRRVTYHESGRVICVGCIDDGSGKSPYENRNKGNCVRIFDDTTFQEVDRIDLDPFEMILSMASLRLKINKDKVHTGEVTSNFDGLRDESGNDQSAYKSFLVLGTAYSYPEEDEPSRGRIILYDSDIHGEVIRKAVLVNEIQVSGGVYSICSFFDGTMLATINTKTRLCKLVMSGPEIGGHYDLKIDNAGHKGHILSLIVKAKQDIDSSTSKQEQIAIVGDLARSVSLIKYYPEYGTLEEIARDFNQNWVTDIEMLTKDIYLGAENFSNLFILRRNADASAEEVRSRLDTVGLFNFGEMVNKFRSGSLVIQNITSNATLSESSNSPTKNDKSLTAISIGSETLFGTIDGTIGCIIGLDAHTMGFLSALERAMARIIKPIGNLKHYDFRSFRAQRHRQGSKGFVDGDMIESFVDLDQKTMEIIVKEMNGEGKWQIHNGIENNDIDDEMAKCEKVLTVSDVITMVEEVSMLH